VKDPRQLFDLTGRVALVTGGSRGLGRAMALGFARAGADVAIASRKLPACEAVAREVEGLGRRALAVACHVGDWAQLEDLPRRVAAALGRLDVLVNNAGMAPVAPSALAVSEDLFDKIVAVNLKGPLRLAALAAEQMREGGVIVNVSSMASLKPTPTTLVYAAAKAGLNALTSALAQELAPRRIRVNCVVPGAFWTESLAKALPTEEARRGAERAMALGRIAEPEEIVGTALYLASEASAFMTGRLVIVDGGLLP
jgi:NAD(P)-dependent dehydrogenase (short-subunit alcohol dehydrogenase family)